MDHGNIGTVDGAGIDFESLDRAEVHTRFDGIVEENGIDRTGRAHHDICAFYRILRAVHRNHLNTQCRRHLFREGFAVCLVRAEATDIFNIAHGAYRHELRSRLPTGTDDPDAARILARQIFHAQSIGGAHTDALHDAVREYRQGLAGLARKQQHQSHITLARRARHFHAADLSAFAGIGDKIGIDADRADTQSRYNAVHGFQAVKRTGLLRCDNRIGAGSCNAGAIGQLQIGLLQHIDALTYRKKLLDIIVRKNKRHACTPLEMATAPHGFIENIYLSKAGRPAAYFDPDFCDMSRELSPLPYSPNPCAT